MIWNVLKGTLYQVQTTTTKNKQKSSLKSYVQYYYMCDKMFDNFGFWGSDVRILNNEQGIKSYNMINVLVSNILLVIFVENLQRI